VVQETDDLAGAKSDEQRWMRFKLDTVGRLDWPRDAQGRPVYPPEFEDLAEKLGRPKHPPGRDVRSIISVGMLTEGWDCNTVTHIVGLRPFMSQLLCEQVVGRALRRTDYELNEEGKFNEELAKVFGVPFEVIPFKATQGEPKATPRRRHVFALPGKAQYEIRFPRVEGYTQAVRSRVAVDWERLPKLVIDPLRIPPEVEMKGLSINNQGRHSLCGPGRLEDVTLSPYRQGRREQQAVFEIGAALAKDYLAQGHCEAPAHVLFPQLARIVQKYLAEKVTAVHPAEKIDVLNSPYYGWLIETLVEHTGPDASQGEAPEVPRYESNRGPGSTADVDYWTTREDVREAERCHLNYVVPDTHQWEQSATYFIDKHPATAAFVKNSSLGFAVPYFHNGQRHDYLPDFIVRLRVDGALECYLILEVKGWDPLEEVKSAAAQRWVAAVNADGAYGFWQYKLARFPSDVAQRLDEALAGAEERMVAGRRA
jgi:type III restriction enzyme